MKIALDIDGVIIDFVSSFIDVLKRELGVLLNYEDIYCHDINQVLALPKKLVNDLLELTLRRNDFKLMPGARESIYTLAQNHEIYIVTGRNECFKSVTEAILLKHNIFYREIYFREYLKKHEIGIPFDIFIEDSVEEAVSLAESVKLVLLYHHPWNSQTLNIKKLFKRVNHWQDILANVQLLEQEFHLNSHPVNG